MAAPEFVPVDKRHQVRVYESPPRLPEQWHPERAGDLEGPQPVGPRLGHPGPDQGYVLTLAGRFEGKLTLTAGEHERDALAGASLVALKRASMFGRAPVIHDLTVALTIWGFLGDAPAELVELRRPLFANVASAHHYEDQRRIVDLVPEDVLRQTPPQVTEAHRRDWRSLLDRSGVPAAH